MEDASSLERDLIKSHSFYEQNLKRVFPGSKEIKDNYCKVISMIEQNNEFIKDPEEQMEQIKKILHLFDSKDEPPKTLYLFSDFLQYNQLKDIENRNTPKEVKDMLLNHFIQKFFQLNNKKEKIISRTNNWINAFNMKKINQNLNKIKSNNMNRNENEDKENKHESSKNDNKINKDYNIFEYYYNNNNNIVNENESNNVNLQNIYDIKNLKIQRINTEIDFTLKRILRLLDEEDNRGKDFEYFLKHFKLKKLDTIFLTKEQIDLHYNLRKDDFEVYLREICFRDKLFYQLRNFEPNFKFINLNSGYDIWKNSRIFLKNITEDLYKNETKKMDLIFNHEKSRCTPGERKVFKEYFKDKYKYYYLLKERMESENLKAELTRSYIFDICYPPLIVTMNSEIKYNMKELCDHYKLDFDISIDKGKAYYYYLDGKIPEIFGNQKNYFNYNLYEIIEIEEAKNVRRFKKGADSQNLLDKGIIINEDEQIFKLENKITDILRDKYHLDEGFNVHSEYVEIIINYI